jgi:hypothetical protein
MADLVDLKNGVEHTIINDRFSTNPAGGLTCIRIVYPEMVAREGRAGWIGVFYQYPDRNWGQTKGLNLSRYAPAGERVLLKFKAKGQTGKEMITFQSGGINRPVRDITNHFQDSYDPVTPDHARRRGLIRLDKDWREYTNDLSGCDLSNVIGPFCWTADSDLNPKGATFYLDEIRIEFGKAGTLRRLEEPRFIRSYVPLLAPTNAPDQFFRNAAYIYDNALALLAYISEGTTEGKRQAKLIAKAFVIAQRSDRTFKDGRLRNAYAAGDLLDGASGFARLPGWWDDQAHAWREDEYFAGTDCGNLAWVLISLITYWEQVERDAEVLKAANDLAEWIHSHGYSTNTVGGYSGGLSGWEPGPKWGGQTNVGWKSTEHNIDIYVAFRRLAAITNSTVWTPRAQHASNFVARMWDSAERHFWTGTDTNGVTTNRYPIPLDAHPWAVLAFRDSKYRDGVLWSITNCGVAGSKGRLGFDFKSRQTATNAPGIWWEGTAQMQLAFQLLGETNQAKATLSLLQDDGIDKTSGGLFATEPKELATGYDKVWGMWQYYRRPHIGATCWYLFAERGWNPYWGAPVRTPSD